MGITLDEAANQTHAACISNPSSAIQVLVIPTNEEWMMAQDARDLLARLYREIGIAAVAAALEIPEAAPAHSVQTLEQQISDVIKRKDMAA